MEDTIKKIQGVDFENFEEFTEKLTKSNNRKISSTGLSAQPTLNGKNV